MPFVKHLLVLLMTISISLQAQTNYYVSPTGSDSNNGLSQSSPFQTLEQARNTIRSTNSSGEVTVWLMDGEYFLDNSFDLTSQDSGTGSNRMVYRAVNKHQAKVSLTKKIQAADLQTITDPALLARINPSATGQVKSIDLSALGVENMATWPDYFSASNQQLFRVYAGGEALQLSRYPNNSFMTMNTVLQNEDPGIFVYNDDRTAAWQDAVTDGGLWLQGYWRVAWQYDAVKTASIDVANKIITQAASVPLGIGDKYTRPAGNGMEPYIAINLMEEIDQAGEWSINFDTGVLYIWLPSGETELNILDKDAPIFNIDNASYVSIIDIAFDYGLGNAIKIKDGYDNLVAGCDISNIVDDAILVENGSSHDIVSNDIHDLGAGGILLQGGDRATLTHGGHTAVNNHIYNFGNVKVIYAPAIGIPTKYYENNVGMYVAHNKIHGTPHVGIEFCGNNNIFEYNEIYDICQVSNDMGAFYSWNDWSSYGNIIRYNYIHDAPQAHGAYMDDGDSGETVHDNIFQNIDVGVFIGGGHDINAYNNLAIDCEKVVHIDNRGVSRGYNLSNTSMVNRVLSVPYQSAPWSTQYPSITSILDVSYPQELPEGCEIDCNVGINTSTIVDIDASTASSWGVTLGTNHSDTDASLTNANLATIAAASGYAGESCIPNIPFTQIGLISDEYRNLGTVVLPVEWNYFTAKKDGKNALLEWQTAQEINNKGFEIQRSQRSPFSGQFMAWETIGFVEGRGDSTFENNYEFVDTKPYLGVNTYRLKQIDLDNKYTYSSVKVVEFFGEADNLLVYPNPANEFLTVKNRDGMSIESLTLFDRVGREMPIEIDGSGVINISTIPDGVYFLEVKTNGKLLRRKVVVF